MTTKYLNKYRVDSHRRKGWDYSRNGMYFITFVTQGRICNLGRINLQNEMILFDFGKIVETEWIRSFEIRQELTCDEYIIMPNHLHAIICIHQLGDGNPSADGDIDTVQPHGRAALSSPSPMPSPSPSSRISKNCIRMPKSISSFLAGFKSIVNSKIDDFIDEHRLDIPKYNRKNHFFQPNYHDHIIRNDQEYQRIKNYIINNPIKWNEDKFKK